MYSHIKLPRPRWTPQRNPRKTQARGCVGGYRGVGALVTPKRRVTAEWLLKPRNRSVQDTDSRYHGTRGAPRSWRSRTAPFSLPTKT